MSSNTSKSSNKMFRLKHIIFYTPLLLLLTSYIHYASSHSAIKTQISKDNFINVYFIKQGWLWTSVVSIFSVVFIKTQRRIKRRVLKHLRMFLTFSLWWYLFTQHFSLISFNSPPMMDVIFTTTGGTCSFDIFKDSTNNVGSKLMVSESFLSTDSEIKRIKSMKKVVSYLEKKATVDYPNSALDVNETVNYLNCNLDDLLPLCKNDTLGMGSITALEQNRLLNDFFYKSNPQIMESSQQCRRVGGHWVGGHDPSGHMFLLTLMIMTFLTIAISKDNYYFVKVIAAIMGILSCYSFMVTIFNFHTLSEQLSGFSAAYIPAALYIHYFM